jgi:hypothetical protein
VTEAEAKLFCCLDALPSPVAGANFTNLMTLVAEIADTKVDQLVIIREVVMQVKEGGQLSKILQGLGGERAGPSLFITRGSDL